MFEIRRQSSGQLAIAVSHFLVGTIVFGLYPLLLSQARAGGRGMGREESGEGAREWYYLVLTTTRLLPKLRHDRFASRTPIRKLAGKRSSHCMISSKGRLFKRSYSRGRIPPLRLTAVRALTWPDDGPKCYAGIQLVNQSGNSPSSLPRFLRGFGSLAGNPAEIDFCPFVRLYCTRSLYGCTLRVARGRGEGRGREGWSLLRFFSKPFHTNTLRFVSIINSALSDPRLLLDPMRWETRQLLAGSFSSRAYRGETENVADSRSIEEIKSIQLQIKVRLLR